MADSNQCTGSALASGATTLNSRYRHTQTNARGGASVSNYAICKYKFIINKGGERGVARKSDAEGEKTAPPRAELPELPPETSAAPKFAAASKGS